MDTWTKAPGAERWTMLEAGFQVQFDEFSPSELCPYLLTGTKGEWLGDFATADKAMAFAETLLKMESQKALWDSKSA